MNEAPDLPLAESHETFTPSHENVRALMVHTECDVEMAERCKCPLLLEKVLRLSTVMTCYDGI